MGQIRKHAVGELREQKEDVQLRRGKWESE